MTELVRLRQQAFLHLMDEVDGIVSLCDWRTDLLVENGVVRKKITLCRHGLPVAEGLPNNRCTGAILRRRAVFFGRIIPVKGLDVLIQAIAVDPDLPVTLDIYGVVQGSGGAAYREQLQKRADGRIRFHEPGPTAGHRRGKPL